MHENDSYYPAVVTDIVVCFWLSMLQYLLLCNVFVKGIHCRMVCQKKLKKIYVDCEISQ